MTHHNQRAAEQPTEEWRVPANGHQPAGDLAGYQATAAAEQPAERRSAGGRALREIFEAVLLAVVIFVAVRAVVLNFRVDGMSMFPNLADEEMLLVNRNAYFRFDANELLNMVPGVEREGENVIAPFGGPERGDVIVFNPPIPADKPYIKRVIALPGEEIEVVNGDVYIDGQRLNEPYISEGITGCGGNDFCESYVVPADEVFVMGDNRDNSSDSRTFEGVPVENIIGKAWVSYWPTDEIGLIPHTDYPSLR